MSNEATTSGASTRRSVTVRGLAEDLTDLIDAIEALDEPGLHIVEQGASDGTLYSRSVEALTLLCTSAGALHQVRALLVAWIESRRVIVEIDLPDAGSLHYEGPLKTKQEVDALVRSLEAGEPSPGS